MGAGLIDVCLAEAHYCRIPMFFK